MEEPLDIEEHFDNYLIRVGLDKNGLSAHVLTELRNSFYAGASSMLIVFRNDIPKLPEDQAIMAMDRLWEQAFTFWRNILKRHEGKNNGAG